MKYLITAAKDTRQVEQEAGSDQLMKKWLQIFRRNSWKVEQVVEVK